MNLKEMNTYCLFLPNNERFTIVASSVVADDSGHILFFDRNGDVIAVAPMGSFVHKV